MSVAQAVVWALLGALVAEAFQLSAMMRPAAGTHGWRWPWASKAEIPMLISAVVFRLFTGCALAAAATAADQICDPGPAFIAGLATPLLVAKLFQVLTAGTSTSETTTVPGVAPTTLPSPRTAHAIAEVKENANDAG